MPSHSIEGGRIRVRYAEFTAYTSSCGCGCCFHVHNWIESAPEEMQNQHAKELGDLLYQILNQGKHKNG